MAQTSVPIRASLPLMAALGLAGSLIVMTLVFWAHYGTRVFFEMIQTGFNACF